jgi:hypothetical protein
MMSDRDNRQVPCHALVLVVESRTEKTESPDTCCRPCTLHHRRIQIRVAVGGLWPFLNAPHCPDYLNTSLPNSPSGQWSERSLGLSPSLPRSWRPKVGLLRGCQAFLLLARFQRTRRRCTPPITAQNLGLLIHAHIGFVRSRAAVAVQRNIYCARHRLNIQVQFQKIADRLGTAGRVF